MKILATMAMVAGLSLVAMPVFAHGIHFTRHMYDEDQKCHETTSHSPILPTGWFWGDCPEPTATPTPTATPEATPWPTINPCDGECESTPTPTPEVTPIPTSEPTEAPKEEGGRPNETDCADMTLPHDVLVADCGMDFTPTPKLEKAGSVQSATSAVEVNPTGELKQFPSTGFDLLGFLFGW